MKRITSFLMVLFTGILFLAGSHFLKSQPVTPIYDSVERPEKCNPERLKCKALASINKDIANLTYDVRRLSVDKQTLPVMRIYMSDGAVNKIDQKRKSVLSKNKPIHISNSGDWVKASAIVEYGDRKEKSKISLRLKGDWGDHMEHPKKLSFRIKTRAGGYLFGLKVFSIQHPATRAFSNEPMILNHMRSHDILAPRYRFVDVYLNDHSIGIMGMEEHFKKEMLESQDRRDGPILALDESDLWNQKDLVFNGPNPSKHTGLNFYPFRDVYIKNYRAAKFERGTIPTNNELRGMALLRDFYDGNIDVSEVFDYDLLSKYWVLTNIWGGCHSAVWHNRRHYFNPITGLFEPISFDNGPHYVDEFKYCIPNEVGFALNDQNFVAKVTEFSNDLFEELQSNEFQKQFMSDRANYHKLLSIEPFGDIPEAFSVDMLIKNLSSFLANFEDTISIEQHKGSLRMDKNEHEARGVIERFDIPLALHITAYYFPQGDGNGQVEFRNLTPSDIEISGFHFKGKKDKVNFELEPFRLVSARTDSSTYRQDISIPEDLLAKKGSFIIDYVYEGKKYEKVLHVQYRNYDSGFSNSALTVLTNVVGKDQIDLSKRQLVIKSGNYEFLESIELPEGWSTIIEPGAVIDFKDGSLLKLRGPLFIHGTENNPVLIRVNSNLNYKDMGRWGGILVSSAQKRSSITHLILEGTGTQNLANRQGYYGMTGCMNFYKSDVTIKHSYFNFAQCEDALNIVKSDFVLDNIVISGARADAFDSDFSTGIVKHSIFKNSGNDGIDVSGTKLRLDHVTMLEIGDKAISVGEKSTLDAKNIDIMGAVIGVASKDLSEAIMKDVRFANISGTALMTYIKKQEYGPSVIDCRNCEFEPGTVKSGRQDGTKIIVNGRHDRDGFLTKQQMIDSGLLEGPHAL